MIASAGASGFRRSSAALRRAASTTSLFVSRPSVPSSPSTSSRALTVVQPNSASRANRGLFDELVFGVGVG